MIQKKILLIILLIITTNIYSKDKKKVLFINSYHKELPWSTGIINATLNEFQIKIDKNDSFDFTNAKVDFMIYHMDTKRNQSNSFKKKAAIEAKKVIDLWKPDAIIAADDNASKYLIEPYYKNATIPIVFCGVNWDHTIYGYPYKNVTGMVEVHLIPQLISTLSNFSKGKRVGFLKGDSLSSRQEGTYFEKAIGKKIKSVFVKNYKSWKKKFISIQKESDILLLGNIEALSDKSSINENELMQFIKKNTSIPTGAWDDIMKKYALITFAVTPEEQGEWAAKSVLKILDGLSPSKIPITKNKNAKVILQMTLAKKLNIKFPMALIDRATLVKTD